MTIRNSKELEESGAINVFGMIGVSKWSTKKFIDDPKASCLQTMVLHGCNKQRFLDYWGRQDFCYTTYRRFWVWVKQLEDCELIIMTAKEKGTCYEVVVTGDSNRATNQIIAFLEKIIEDTTTDEDRELIQ